MTASTVVDRPVAVAESGSGEQLEDIYQVVLWNDDHNFADFVVRCLVQVFGHAIPLAVKIMHEAHHRGKAIAQVEGKETAALHCQQLLSFGLTATLEQI